MRRRVLHGVARNADLALRVNNVQQSRFQLDRKGLLLLASNSRLDLVDIYTKIQNASDATLIHSPFFKFSLKFGNHWK